jgi:uncharacterized protein
MSRIYWDTMLFIYWLEDNPQYAKRVHAIHSRMQARGDQLLTAALTFGEVLAGVYRKGAFDTAAEIRRQLERIVTQVVPFTTETADHYARIRATLALAPADAIHLASAAHARTDLFLTNDKRLLGKFVSGIHFIASFEDDVL